MIDVFPAVNGTVKELPGFFKLPCAFSADLGEFSECSTAAFYERTDSVRGGDACLRLVRDEALAAGAYRLEVSENGITVGASCEAGVIYALTTAAQLSTERAVPCCEILDEPVYSHRGLSLDTVRHFVPVQEIKRIMEQMSLVRMSILHLHLTDDQGWRIESLRYPELNTVGGEYYTRDELTDIVKFAESRGLEILPEIDLPGHTTSVLAAYPELGCSGKRVDIAQIGGIFTDILCAGKESVYTFVSDLLDEVCGLFPYEYFHIGGDESPRNAWAKCPDCRRVMEENGLDNFNDLQGLFMRRVAELLRQHGKKPFCWNDILTSRLMPDDVRIQYWTVNDFKSSKEWLENGGKFIYSDMFEIYLNYPYSMTGMKKLSRFTPAVGRTPCAKMPGAEGIEACIWLEQIDNVDDLEAHLFPRLYVVAEKAWKGINPGGYAGTVKRLAPILAAAEVCGINLQPENGWNPKGKKRVNEAMTFMQGMINCEMPEPMEGEEDKPLDKDYMKSFATRFFRPWDIVSLLKLLKTQKK